MTKEDSQIPLDEAAALETDTTKQDGERAVAERLRTGWRDAVLSVAAHYQLNASAEHIRLAADWSERASVVEQAREMARQAGLSLQLLQPQLGNLNPWRLPVVLELDGGQVAVVTAMNEEGLTLSLIHI